MIYLQLSSDNKVEATVENFELLTSDLQEHFLNSGGVVVESMPVVEVPDGQYIVWYYEDGAFRFELYDLPEPEPSELEQLADRVTAVEKVQAAMLGIE